MSVQRITINHARTTVGTIGFPSKMPGTSFGIPARHCKTGSKLRQIKGSTCARCYAFGNNYQYESVTKSQDNRFDKLGSDGWRDAMSFMLNKYHGLIDGKAHYKITDPNGRGWHRWHDAGDIQSEEHLDDIVAVCRATPKIKHWLPTREIGIVSRWLMSRHGASLEQMNKVLPRNLCIRISATMVDGNPTARAPNTSTVHKHNKPAERDRCVAPDHDGHCGPCRKCWNQKQQNTSYHIHS